ncbi:MULTISPECIES: ABC transporter permease [Bacillus]|uniref:ABC transporter permease n=1 Tax=Bacillus TaxID=1386 RepID=UPI001583779D|nr:ABC transporter permease [Bacillus glycinifermentans]MBU8787782.1 ABC transporter permease [Bacillus glycinifermentans]NUJ17643.1 ABC transporter permease [Bacillus glycinifermentans]
MFSLSLKEIRFFKLRYSLIGFIYFFVASLVFIISGLANGLSADNASSILNMDAHAFYLDKDADHRLDRSRFDDQQMEKLTKNNAIQPIGLQMASLKKEGTDQKVDVSFMGINPNGFLMPDIKEGARLSSSSKPLTLVVDNSLKQDGVRIGDHLYDERSQLTFEIIGFTEHQTFSHSPVAFMNLKSWGKLTNSSQKFYYNAFVLKDEDQETQNNVQSIMKDGTWVTKDEVVQGIPGYKAEQSSLLMMLVFLIIIAVFVLGAFFFIMTIQKINEFGVLKAIGAKNTFLIGSTLLQVVILSVFSIGGAIGFTGVLKVLMPEEIPFVFDVSLILVFSVILLIVSILGALLSAVNIVKADPLQAIGRTE